MLRKSWRYYSNWKLCNWSFFIVPISFFQLPVYWRGEPDRWTDRWNPQPFG